MRKSNVVKLLAIVVCATTLTFAQATRTWVSGVGDDANPCSRTAPCKTFAGAISKTATGGEIDALDPGGFGALTITKAITLDGGGGQVASVLVAGTNGIVVNAPTSDVVIIRNLRINGISAGLNGISFLQGKSLDIENCTIFGFLQNGINIALNQNTTASVHIINTVVKHNNQVGIKATNAQGPQPNGGVQVLIEDSKAMVDTTGVEAAQHSRVVFFNSVAGNASGDGLLADDAASADAQMTVEYSESSYNTNGITAGAGSNVSVGNSKAAFNSSCSLNTSGGNLFSYTWTPNVFTNQLVGAICGGAPTQRAME